VMGRPEESRLRVGGAVEAGDASGDGMVHVGGGMIMSPAEVGWGGRDSTPAEVGDGVDVGEVEAEEMAQWATSVTDDQEVVPVVVVHQRAWCQPGGRLGEDGSSLPVSGGNERGSAVAVTVQVPSSASSKVRPTRPVPSGVGLGRCGEDGDDVGRGAGSSKVNREVGKWSSVSVVRMAAVEVM
jgi:hypothetical protein